MNVLSQDEQDYLNEVHTNTTMVPPSPELVDKVLSAEPCHLFSNTPGHDGATDDDPWPDPADFGPGTER